ncbi:hypothetical protein ES695_01350 [Candidatus Atribacteria bacterium 1244-E10-H5-B2]|nr:MAG: hypothetical protein ES695_01350 [Candidatus Atribacteria bacterium 1244-E10-H5-B2]
MVLIKIKALKETISFYKMELEKEGLTERERDKYLKALKIIEKVIKGKERSGEKEKHKEFIAYDHKAVFQDSKREY